MIGETGFRVVLASAIVASIVAVIVSHLSEASLPPELQNYMMRQAEAPISGRQLITGVIAVPAAVLILISTIGMFFFWRPSRLLAVIGIVLILLSLPFTPPFVESGIASLFNDSSSILWGMVLALAYWSPIAARFEKSGI